MTTAAKFWDKAARKYAASPIKDMAAYEYTLERVRSYLRPDQNVLEIGAGTGSTALLLAPEVAALTSTDISPEMMVIAKEKAASQSVKNVTFKVADGQQAAAMAGGKDVVLGFNIFHLTPDPAAIFRALHQEMAPGALFISKTPCLSEPSLGLKRFGFAALIPVLRLFGIAPFVGQFSFAQLEGMIEEAGFEIVETGSFPAMSRFVVARKGG